MTSCRKGFFKTASSVFITDKMIRHRACTLRDTAYALIKAEMDTDFEEQCQEISRNRKTRQEKIVPAQEPEVPSAITTNGNTSTDVKVHLFCCLFFYPFVGITQMWHIRITEWRRNLKSSLPRRTGETFGRPNPGGTLRRRGKRRQ